MAPKKGAKSLESPRGKRTSAAGFSALALLSGEGRPGSPAHSKSETPAQPKKAPKKRASAKAPPPPPIATATVSGRPKAQPQREADRPAAGSSVRVWWPPTRDPEKTGFSGAFWPAKVAAGPSGGAPGAEWATVRYDNGEKARAFLDDLFPSDQPVAFGEERHPLRAGEFVEVHNGSASDPCAWFGLAKKVAARAGECSVEYPMHDSPAETIPLERVRRVRLWEGGGWQLPRPGQRWQPGEVTSPRELELLPEKEYVRRFAAAAGAAAAVNGWGGGGGGQAGGGGGSAGKGAGKKAAAAAAASKKTTPKAAAPKAAAPKAAKKQPVPKKKGAAAAAKPPPAGKRPIGRPKKAK